MSDLKPCPFCGSAANDAAYLGFGNWHVDCSVCPASVDGIGPEEATAAWNNRVEAFGAVGELQGAGDAGCARRSGGLRPEPSSTVSALRAPAAIARGETK